MWGLDVAICQAFQMNSLFVWNLHGFTMFSTHVFQDIQGKWGAMMLVSFANANPPIAQGSEWDHMDKFSIPKLSETVTERQIQMGSSVQRGEGKHVIWGSGLKHFLQSQEKQAINKWYKLEKD